MQIHVTLAIKNFLIENIDRNRRVGNRSILATRSDQGSVPNSHGAGTVFRQFRLWSFRGSRFVLTDSLGHKTGQDHNQGDPNERHSQ